MKKNLEVRNKLAVFYEGKQISPYNFDDFKEINGYIIAYNSTSFTIYDSFGNIVLLRKVSIEEFFDNYFIVTKNNCKGVYRFDGTCIFPIKFDFIEFYRRTTFTFPIR